MIDLAGRRSWKRILTVGGVAAVLVSVATSVHALQAPGNTHRPTEHFSISYASSRDVGIAHGPVVGSGAVDVYASRDVLHLGHGTLTLTFDTSKLKATGGVDPKTCFVHYRIRVPYRVGHGTEKYRGVEGHGVLKGTEQALARRQSNGTCRSGHYRDEVAFFTGSGPLTATP